MFAAIKSFLNFAAAKDVAKPFVPTGAEGHLGRGWAGMDGQGAWRGSRISLGGPRSWGRPQVGGDSGMKVSISQGDAIFLAELWERIGNPGHPKIGRARALEMPKGRSRASSGRQNHSLDAVK